MPIIGTLNLSGCNYQMAYDVISQDVANNSTTISLYGILNVTNSYVAWSSGSASVHTASAGLSTRYNKGSYLVVQRNFTFTHNEDGSKTVSLGYSLSSTYTSGSGIANLTLPKINRVAVTNSVTSEDNINDVEGKFKINYTKYISSYNYKLRVSIPEVVELEKIDYNTSGADYQLSSAALETLLNRMTGNTINLGFAVETWNGNSNLSRGNEVVLKCKLVNGNPIFVDYDIEETNNTIKALTGSTKNNVINVNGYSNIKATITADNKAVAIKKATMNKYRFLIDGNTPVDISYSDSEDVTGTIEGALTGVYKLYAIDSRDNSTLVTKQATAIKDYSKVSFNKTSCKIERDDNQVGENAVLTLDGSFWNDNFGETSNNITITYRFRQSDSDTWTTGATTITPTKDGNSFIFEGNIAGDNNSKWNLGDSYIIEITVADELTTDTVQLILNSSVPTLSLDKNGVGVLCSYDNDKGGTLQIAGEVYMLHKIVGSASMSNVNARSGDFNVENFQSIIIEDSNYAESSNGGIKIKKAGTYRVTFLTRMKDGNGNCFGGISINGSSNDNYGAWLQSATRVSINSVQIFNFNVNDVIKYVHQGSSVSGLGISNSKLWIEYIG